MYTSKRISGDSMVEAACRFPLALAVALGLSGCALGSDVDAPAGVDTGTQQGTGGAGGTSGGGTGASGGGPGANGGSGGAGGAVGSGGNAAGGSGGWAGATAGAGGASTGSGGGGTGGASGAGGTGTGGAGGDPGAGGAGVLGGDPGPSWRVLSVDYQVQETGYWCAPAATRIALSARMMPPSQATLASELGTTTNGTDWIGQVTAELDDRLGLIRYRTTEMSNDPPTQAQRDLLWNDVVLSIDNNYPIVANIVAPPSNHPPGYPNDRTIYHYLAVIGYNPDTMQVYIADSANFGGNQLYWLSFEQLATLIPPKGYTSYQCPTGMTVGAIGQKYQALGGCRSVVGGAVTGETATPDGVGRYTVFENGSIYWTPSTGAHEVHGSIRDKWRDLGWEGGSLGYPISDEYPVVGGKRNDFEHGSLVWHSSTAAVVQQ